MRIALVVALFATVALVTVPRAQDSVDGDWTLVFDTPMGAMDASATFKADGEELTGTISSQAGMTSFKGTIKGAALSFVMHVATPQGDISIEMNGEVNGDDITGTFDFGQGVGNWMGKRVKGN